MAYPITERVREQRRSAATKHGAKNQVRLRRQAGYVKQSVLQASGLRQADLDPITRRYLDLYARVASKIQLYDEWGAEHGWLDTDGNSPGFVREYYAALNAAGRLLSKLDEHLRRHRQDAPSPLDLHLQEHYADAEEAEFSEVNGDGG